MRSLAFEEQMQLKRINYEQLRNQILHTGPDFDFVDLFVRRMDILVRRMAKQHCPNASSCNAGIFRRWDAFGRGLGQECPSYVNRSIALS